MATYKRTHDSDNRRFVRLEPRPYRMNSLRFLNKLLSACLAAAALVITAPAFAQSTSTMVRIHTNQGAIDNKLLDTDAPITVTNFLTYVRSNAYVDTFLHRMVKGFVLQGGGYGFPASGYAGHIPVGANIVNEFNT